MTQPRSLVGSAAPLFEKLTDLAPGSAEDDQDLTFQSRDALIASIRRELSRILDSRLPWRDDAPPLPGAGPATVIAYGIPDLTHLCLRKPSDRAAIERLVTEAIRAFEPRLLDPQAHLVITAHQDRAYLDITGAIRTRRALEPLSFHLDITLRLGDGARRKG